MKTKTKIIFATLLLVIIGSLMACEDCLFPDDPAVITNTIKTLVVGTGGTITPSTEVISGKNSTVNFNPDVGYDIDIVKIDGVVTVLIDNLSYTFINVSSNHKVEVTFKKTLLWYAMQGAWILNSVLVKQQNGTWADMIINSRDSVLFFPTGRYKTYRDGKWIGEGNWSINELTNPPTFNYGGYVSNIGKLDDNELIMETEDIIDKYSHH